MNRLVKVLLSASIILQLQAAPCAFAFPESGTVAVYFSPRGGATEAIVREIGNAQREVLIQAYSFTSAPIAKAIVEAHKRGVSVIAVLDKSQRTEKYTSATFLANAGVPVLIDDKHAIAHNKIIIIDRSILITGSFNFTKAAEESNAENLLVIKGSQSLIDKYLQNFDEHKSHSVSYQAAGIANSGGKVKATAITPRTTDQASIIVYRTMTGKKYHTENCLSLSKSKIALSLKEAVDMGLIPCSICNPPTLSSP